MALSDSSSDYWGPAPVFVSCHGADMGAVDISGGRMRCLGCSEVFAVAETDPDPAGGDRRFPPAHQRQVPAHEQAVGTLTQIAGLIGVDPTHPAVEQAIWVATSSSSGPRRPLHDMVASGLCELARVLTVSAANAAAAHHLDELAAFHADGDDAPFFTEATLYDLVGKDSARTLLALLASAQRSTGPAPDHAVSDRAGA